MTSAGVVAVLLASEPVFRAVKLAGALHLVGLGLHSLLAALRSGQAGVAAIESRALARLRPLSAFRQGVLNNLGNPKMAVFFASVLPQFASPDRGMLGTLLLLGMVFSALTLSWLAVYAALVSAAGALFRRSRVRRAVEAVTGAALVGLGARLALEER
jgi:threonine/homoserine/homoserine lactone efflux protein